MQEIKLSDYFNSFSSKKPMEAVCNGIDLLRQGGNTTGIPVFVFFCEDYKFYMPFSLYSDVFADSSTSQDVILKTMSPYSGKRMDFIVLNIDRDLKVGVVSHLEVLKSERENYSDVLSKSNEVLQDETFDAKIVLTSRNYIHVEIVGFRKTLHAENFPSIKSRVLSDVFKVGEFLKCSVKKINEMEPFSEDNMEVIPLEYPKIPEEFDSLKVGSYYSGEVLFIRNDNSGVIVDCFGNRVFCEYPPNFIPVVKMNAVVKITNIRKDKEHSYFGIILFCEMPIGTY